MKNIRITFVLAKSRLNQLGKCSIRCRITHEKKRYEFSTGLFVKPKEWFNSAQEVRPSSKDNDFINTQLSLIKQKINQAFLFLQLLEEEFDVEDIYNYYRGDTINKKLTGVIEFYNDYLDKLKKLISKDFKFKTYRKFEEILNDVRQFILIKYKKKELSLSKLDYNFIENFEFYLKTERKMLK